MARVNLSRDSLLHSLSFYNRTIYSTYFSIVHSIIPTKSYLQTALSWVLNSITKAQQIHRMSRHSDSYRIVATTSPFSYIAF
ncbi:hypothetical protein ACRN94_19535 [Shewanella baltica]|uniref:hypothetical protein n=1 Tax=Shewanella baltica TaxID=62322 RepID=UPI003D7916BB